MLQQKIQKLEHIVHGDNAPNRQSERHSTTIVNALNTNLLETTKKFGETLKLRTHVCYFNHLVISLLIADRT